MAVDVGVHVVWKIWMAAVMLVGSIVEAVRDPGRKKHRQGLRAERDRAERQLADQVRTLGEDHPDTLDTRGLLGNLRSALGDMTGAVEEYERRLAGQERVLGADHPSTRGTRSALASLRRRAGKDSRS